MPEFLQDAQRAMWSDLNNTRAVVYLNRYHYDGRQTTNEPRVFGLRLKYRFGGKT